MTSNSETTSATTDPAHPETVEMPQETVWPLVLGLGVTLLAAGLALNLYFAAAGAVLFLVGLCGWIASLLPGKGHMHEPLVEPALRPQPVSGVWGTVDHLRPGLAGYRFRLPEKVHPISAGIKGGIIGGLVMPLPAMLYGLLSPEHSIWFPINLLVGMVLPGMDAESLPELEKFNFTYLVLALFIHATISVGLGLMYGVLLPTLPEKAGGPFVWGGLLMPVLWTAGSYVGISLRNPELGKEIDWRWFVLSQVIYGLVAGGVVVHALQSHGQPLAAGLRGGIIGGLVMPLPAVAYGLFGHNSIWFPINLLAGLVAPGLTGVNATNLVDFNATALVVGIILHALVSVGLGLLYGLLLQMVPAETNGQLIWGGLLMPVLWTGLSYGFMGVINPLLQRKVDWRWFIVSQVVYGLVAAMVVVRSEKIAVEPVAATGRPAAGTEGGARP